MSIKPRMVPRMICLALALGSSLSWAAASLNQAPLTVTGRGFVIKTIQTGATAFANRHYVWLDVPTWLNGWQYTEVKGGHAAEMTIFAAQDCDVYIATTEPPDAAWQPANEGVFAYSDKGRTTMHVYGRHLLAQSTVPVPQRGWAGTLVLAPELSGVTEREPRETVVREGAALIVPEVVVAKHAHRRHVKLAVRETRRLRKASRLRHKRR